MSKYKDMAKEKLHGGHDKASHFKNGAKGKVNGLIGRGNKVEESNHVAAPLTSLRDPNSFAPPPKRTGTGLLPPPPPTVSQRKVITAPSKYQDPRGAYVEPPEKISNERYLLEAAESQEQTKSPALPYRTNTTGLSTDHLPKPPPRRDGADGRSPPPYEANMGMKKLPASASSHAAPSLPPRLPPRSGSGASSPERMNSPVPIPGPGTLNQGAVSRLGAAGISVPGFGIGSSSPANTDAPAPPQPPRPSNTSLNQLSNRFAKLGTSTSSANTGSASAPPPGEGTTWAQKQAALKTASAFHKDPSSVSFADAKAAASTANNFRQRHGEQVAAGLQTANSLNQKYGVADKVGSLASQTGVTANSTESVAVVATVAGKKKPPPPPPPKKKPGFASSTSSLPKAEDAVPPPIPLSTRPAF